MTHMRHRYIIGKFVSARQVALAAWPMCIFVTVGQDIAARRLAMCGNHGFALQLAYRIAC
jgi:hypothetical protein